MSRKVYTIIFLVLAVLGFLDATYLSAETLMHKQVYCSIVTGCNEVLGSKYSHIGPIPVSVFGSAYYLTLLVLAGLLLQHRKQILRKIIKYITWIGLLASAVFVFLMLAVIKSICVYCFASAITSTLLFLVAHYGVNKAEELEIDIKL